MEKQPNLKRHIPARFKETVEAAPPQQVDGNVSAEIAKPISKKRKVAAVAKAAAPMILGPNDIAIPLTRSKT